MTTGAGEEVTIRVLERDVAFRDRSTGARDGTRVAKAGTRLRLEIVPYPGDPEGMTGRVRLTWGKGREYRELRATARRAGAGREWTYGVGIPVAELVSASRPATPVGYEEERDTLGLDEEDDSVLVRVLYEDAETRPLLLAAMAAIAAGRVEHAADGEGRSFTGEARPVEDGTTPAGP